MAKIVMLKHAESGIVKKGFFGFSWTTLFFGGFPALFRGDILTGIIVMLISIITCGIGSLIWAFFYNKSYTTKLLEKGYRFADSDGIVALAKSSLGVGDMKAAEAESA